MRDVPGPSGDEVARNIVDLGTGTPILMLTAADRLSDKVYEIAQEIVVDNARKEAVEVEVAGQLPRGWSMLQESQDHELESANRIFWRLQVPAGGSTTLTYRLRVNL